MIDVTGSFVRAGLRVLPPPWLASFRAACAGQAMPVRTERIGASRYAVLRLDGILPAPAEIAGRNRPVPVQRIGKPAA